MRRGAAIAAMILCALVGRGTAQQQHLVSLGGSSSAAGEFLAPDSISGMVVDADGRAVAGAHVELVDGISGTERSATTGNDGEFDFESAEPGAFTLKISAAGFAAVTEPGALRTGEILELPAVVLGVGSVDVDVEAALSTREVAEEQLHAQEQQRLVGVLPNFFISYNWAAAPLTTGQKYRLAFRVSADPVNIGLAAATAGVQQGMNTFPGYHQGAAGYAKRLGANLGDLWVGTYMGGAVLPSVFRQDPRYFYRGTGSAPSRAWYAVTRAFVCRGDNGKWQPSYSGILGDLSEGAISNIYYPASSRQGAMLTFENGLLSIGEDAIANVLQELVFPHFTTNKAKGDGAEAQDEQAGRKVRSDQWAGN
jgi:Carboxypeptidase regulatory-like domain